MSSPIRDPGYYWVRPKPHGAWEIAEYLGADYTSTAWLRMQIENTFQDGDFLEIGPRIQEPSE